MTLNPLILSNIHRKSITLSNLNKDKPVKKLESFFRFLYQTYYSNKYRYKRRYLKKYRKKRIKFLLTILRFRRFFFNRFVCVLDSLFRRKPLSIRARSFFYPFILLSRVSTRFHVRKTIRKYFLRGYGKRLDLFSAFCFRNNNNYFSMIANNPEERYLLSFLPKEKLLSYVLLLDRFFHRKSSNSFSPIFFQNSNLFSKIFGNFSLFRSSQSFYSKNNEVLNSSFYYFIYNIINNNLFYFDSISRDFSFEDNKLAYILFLKQSLSFNFTTSFTSAPAKILRNTNTILIYAKFISGEWKKHLFNYSFKQFFFQSKLSREVGLLFLKHLYITKRIYQKFLVRKKKRKNKSFYRFYTGSKYPSARLKSRIRLMKVYFLAYFYLSSKGNFINIPRKESEQYFRDQIRLFRKRRRWRMKFYKRMSRLRVKKIDFKKLKNVSFKEYYDTYINPQLYNNFKKKPMSHMKDKPNVNPKSKSNADPKSRHYNRFQSATNQI